MGQEPDAIRHEIEETRERMGQTVDALSYKADVKTRTKESVKEKVDTLKSKVTGATDGAGEMTGRVTDAVPSSDDVAQAARRGAGLAQDNPLGLAIGSVAAGFLLGMLLPSTRAENERLGPMADEVKDRVRETGQEAMDHGRELVAETAQSAMSAAQETVQEQGGEHAEQLRDSAQQATQDVRQQVGSAG